MTTIFWLLSLPLFCAPIGNPKAPVGGNLTVGFSAYPKSLNYYLANEEFTMGVSQLVLEPLIEMEVRQFKPVPRLARSWAVSPDKKTYTFKLDPKAKFSDGVPVTSEDVKFTWNAIYDPKNKTAPFQSYFSSFSECRAVDPLTVEFKVKTVHFQNLEKLADFLILPRHVYSNGDFNKGFNNRFTGSGPYTLDTLSPGEKIQLRRNPAYWGWGLSQNIGRYNFERLVFKAVPDVNVLYEIFKKGDVDYFYFLSAKMWSTETDGPLFQKGYLKKLRGENKSPVATQGIAWNLRRGLFQDARVRRALSLLLDRPRLIKEIFFHNYRISTGIVSPDSPYHPPDLKPLPYEPREAKRLLTLAGWSKVDSEGVLIKDGLRFSFEMLIDNPSHQRYLTIYQEDLKKMGIAMNIRIQDWATCLRLMDDRQFDAHLVARSRTVHPFNIADEWGSAEADVKGSGNFTGYKNPKVDTLSSRIDETFDVKKRIPLVREIARLIAKDVPFTPTWEAKFFRIGYRNRFSFPGSGYMPYSTWRDAFQYWWSDTQKASALQSAMASGAKLP